MSCCSSTAPVKKKKDPNAPKRPMTAYLLFCQDSRAQIKQSNPDMSFVELTRELGAQWGRLTDEQKQPFVRKAQEDKERYQREMAEYQPTEQETNSEKTDQKAPEDNVHDDVREYYSKVLTQTKDLKTSACTSASKPHPIIQEALKHVPAPIKEKFYGCGTPIPLGIDGLTVLDLGSGSGRDCYIAAKLVGEDGRVIGVDMTDEQLSVAKEHVDEYMKTLGREESNLEFRKGYIEDLEQTGIEPDSVDIVISNCVVNLSPKKDQVLRGVYRVLKEGGEFYFSDVYADRRIAKHVQEHKVLYGECISGAMYVNDFIRLCHQVGFQDPRVVTQSEITVDDEELQEVIGNTRFYSITYRLFKLKNLETLCEDYGQYAVYHGGIDGHKWKYELDDHHTFYTNKPVLVCGNTASMLEETWLNHYFEVVGDRETHYGIFDCAPKTETKKTESTGKCC